VPDLDLRAGDDDRQATVRGQPDHPQQHAERGGEPLDAVGLAATSVGADGFVWPLIPTAAMLVAFVPDFWGGGRGHGPHGRRRHGPPPPPRLPR